jgi:thiol:disulfide interchange protein DsbD
MKKTKYGLYAFILALFMFPRAVSAEPVRSAYVQVELITNIQSIRPGQPFWVGLSMDMDDGWQTYWKNPGDSGLATTIEWELPEGFEAGEIQWPYPIRMDYPEITSYGYEDKVVLMTQITPPENLALGISQTIKARAVWLSCGNMCVPGKADLSLEMPVLDEEPALNLPALQMFDETMKNWPKETTKWAIGVYDEGDVYRLQLISPAGEAILLTGVAFFPESNDLIDHQAQQAFEKIGNSYRLTVPKSAIAYRNVTELKGVLVAEEPWEENRRALLINEPINFQESM